MNLIALSGLTVSLGPIVASVFDAAIAIVHGDRDGHRGRRSRRRAAVAIVRLVRRLLRREIAPPPIEPFTWSVARHPLRPFAHGDSKRIGRVPFPMKRKRKKWRSWLIRLDSL